MRWRDAVAMAGATLRSQGARTLMTILGLAVGVAAVLTVQALGRAGEAQVEREIERMGVNRVWVTRSDGGALTEDDARLASAAAHAPACAGATMPGIVTFDGVAFPATLAAYDEAMQAVHGAEMAQGRAFLPSDHGAGRAVCIVDAALAQELGGDVVGRRISLAGRMFMVVGVAQSLPASAMTALGVAAVPLSAWEDTSSSGAQELTIAVPAGADAEILSRQIANAMGPDFRVNTLSEEVAAARHIVRIFVGVLTCVAGVCMITGGIGVMNVVMLSVRERRREIGLMKALGATAWQVALLFLLEAVGYAALGGAGGLALGVALTAMCGAWVGVEAAVTASGAAPVLALAALLGVIVGVAPAIRAARLEVVDALRQQ